MTTGNQWAAMNDRRPATCGFVAQHSFPGGGVRMRCACGAVFSTYHRNAMARASKVLKAWNNHYKARLARGAEGVLG